MNHVIAEALGPTLVLVEEASARLLASRLRRDGLDAEESRRDNHAVVGVRIVDDDSLGAVVSGIIRSLGRSDP